MNAYKLVIERDKIATIYERGKGKGKRWVPIKVISIDYIMMSAKKDRAEIGFWGIETK